MRELAVANGAAERGVQAGTEYANVTRDGNLRGRIIAVASSHRAAAPNMLQLMLKHELGRMLIVLTSRTHAGNIRSTVCQTAMFVCNEKMIGAIFAFGLVLGLVDILQF